MTLESENKPNLDVTAASSGLISRGFHTLQTLWQEEREGCRVVYGSRAIGSRLFVKEQRGILSREFVFRRLHRLDALGYSSNEAWITYNNLSVDAMMKRISSARKS